MFYDTHCHLDFEAFDGDRDEVVARALAAGVTALLVPGLGPTQWARAATVDPGELRCEMAVGVHPDEVGASLDTLVEDARRLGAVAIGELGWDTRRGPARDAQDRAVDAQLEVAKELGLPVVLHVVGAHGHALERLARFSPLAGVVHAYSGSAALVARYVELGLHVGIGPSVLRHAARRPLEAARAVPADRLLLETDAPDQCPPDRARGEPADVVEVARAVAAARGESLEAIAALTYANAIGLFGSPD